VCVGSSFWVLALGSSGIDCCGEVSQAVFEPEVEHARIPCLIEL